MKFLSFLLAALLSATASDAFVIVVDLSSCSDPLARKPLTYLSSDGPGKPFPFWTINPGIYNVQVPDIANGEAEIKSFLVPYQTGVNTAGIQPGPTQPFTVVKIGRPSRIIPTRYDSPVKDESLTDVSFFKAKQGEPKDSNGLVDVTTDPVEGVYIRYCTHLPPSGSAGGPIAHADGTHQ